MMVAKKPSRQRSRKPSNNDGGTKRWFDGEPLLLLTLVTAVCAALFFMHSTWAKGSEKESLKKTAMEFVHDLNEAQNMAKTSGKTILVKAVPRDMGNDSSYQITDEEQ